MNRNLLISCATTIALLSPTAEAQSVAPGFSSTTEALATGSGQIAVTSQGIATFDGQDLVLTDSQGATTTLLSFANPVFGSFTVEADRRGLLLFGESSNGEVWAVALPGSGFTTQLVATLAFNFSATPFGGTEFLVSAKTTGFGTPDNDIVHVDAATGSATFVATVPGASGPLARIRRPGRRPNFLYATASLAFPAPPGSTSIVEFSETEVRSALNSGSAFAIDLSSPRVTGLDSATAIAADRDRFPNIYVSDFISNSVIRVDGGTGAHSTFSDFPGAGTLQFLRRGFTEAQFDPYQPEGAGTLVIHESSFLTGSSVLRSVQPARPTLVLPQTPAGMGNVSLGVDGAPALASGVFLLGDPPTGREFVFPAGFAPPLFYDRRLVFTGVDAPITSDAMGRVDLTVMNPGLLPPGIPGTIEIGIQAFLIDPGLGAFVSSAPGSFEIR